MFHHERQVPVNPDEMVRGPVATDRKVSMTVMIAMAQITPVWENPDATLQRIIPLVRQASDHKADLICFPEQFATGWDPASVNHTEPSGGRIVSGLSRIAGEFGIAVLGSIRLRENGSLYNAAVAIGQRGEVSGIYRKMHLFSPQKEDSGYAPGKDITIFSVGDMEFGMAICYDLRFSSLFHIYAAAGVDGVIVPAAWPAPRMEAWELFIRSHALEDQMFVVGVNTTGTTPVGTYGGGSIAAGPYGELVARAGSDEGLTFATLDAGRIEEARRAIPAARDRKPGVYHEIYRKRSRHDGEL
jgi:omega-amidase